MKRWNQNSLTIPFIPLTLLVPYRSRLVRLETGVVDFQREEGEEEEEATEEEFNFKDSLMLRLFKLRLLNSFLRDRLAGVSPNSSLFVKGRDFSRGLLLKFLVFFEESPLTELSRIVGVMRAPSVILDLRIEIGVVFGLLVCSFVSSRLVQDLVLTWEGVPFLSILFSDSEMESNLILDGVDGREVDEGDLRSC